jgi:hypothetical protein
MDSEIYKVYTVNILRVSSTPKMEAACSAQTAVSMFQITWRYIPEAGVLIVTIERNLHLVMINLFNNSEGIFVQELIRRESVIQCSDILRSLNKFYYMKCNMNGNMYLL